MKLITRFFKLESDSLLPLEKQIITLAALGGILESYDFLIYGIFSIYFAHQFFPANNESIIILQSYIVFVLGYIARPLGGIIFSHIGDEYGRKKVLVITIVLMGLSSLGIGFLPTYSQIGIAAPCLLLLLRLLQGFAFGGELPSTYVYITETIPKNYGIAFGITMIGVNGGVLLGMLINFILNQLLTNEELIDFGWRFPFLIGGLLCLISYQIRKKLQETDVFCKIHNKAGIPLVKLFRFHLKTVGIGIAFTAFLSSSVIVSMIFMPTYLQNILKLDRQLTGSMMILLMIVNLTVIYCTGKTAQNLPPLRLLAYVTLSSMVLIPISYILISHSKALLGLIILGALEGTLAMLIPYLLTTLFESDIRLTGVALSYNIGFTLFGGLAPLIITYFIQLGYNAYWVPVFYLLCMACTCGLALLTWKRKKEKSQKPGYLQIKKFKIVKKISHKFVLINRRND